MKLGGMTWGGIHCTKGLGCGGAKIRDSAPSRVPSTAPSASALVQSSRSCEHPGCSLLLAPLAALVRTQAPASEQPHRPSPVSIRTAIFKKRQSHSNYGSKLYLNRVLSTHEIVSSASRWD